jgi:hypothetical protein
MIFPRHGLAGLGRAGQGLARQYVTGYGNPDNFSGRGGAWFGAAGLGEARQHAYRWAVSPDNLR